jgi:hypothetical protein
MADLSPRSGEFILGWVEYDGAVEVGQGQVITPLADGVCTRVVASRSQLAGRLAMTVLSSDSQCLAASGRGH